MTLVLIAAVTLVAVQVALVVHARTSPKQQLQPIAIRRDERRDPRARMRR